MKNKSSKHKQDNTFKFQLFSERLAAINIDVYHRIDHINERESEEDGTYFYQDMKKWEVLNLTDGFVNFRKEIRSDVFITLPQLILSKEHVVGVLLKHLRLKNPLSLQPLLSLTASLARDLRKEFYEYYSSFYDVLLELLRTKDTDQLEWVFSCLAYFFKYLWRFIIRDISKVFETLLPLLSENEPEYINNFAAESFAFVTRKVKEKDEFFNYILKSVHQNKQGVIGCGKLLFEVIKGVSGSLHSCTKDILIFLLKLLCENVQYQSTLLEILEYMFAHVVDYIDTQKSKIFLETLLSHLDGLIERWQENGNSVNAENINNVLKLLGQVIEQRDGKIVQTSGFLIKQMKRLLMIFELSDETTTVKMCIQISIILLLSKNNHYSQEDSWSLIQTCMSIDNSEVKLYFVENMIDFPLFDALILSDFLKSCIANELDKNHFRALTNIILQKEPLNFDCINLNGKPSTFLLNPMLMKAIKNKLHLLDEDGFFKRKEEIFCLLVCIPHVINKSDTERRKNVLETLHNFVSILMKHITTESLGMEGWFFFNVSLECLYRMDDVDFFTKNFDFILNSIFATLNEKNIISSLKILCLILIAVKDTNLVDIVLLKKINKHLKYYFSSPFHEVRRYVTFIYSLFEKLAEFQCRQNCTNESEENIEDLKIFSICLAIESNEPQIRTYRDQIRYLEKLTFENSQMSTMLNLARKYEIDEDFECLPLRYLCGYLYVNFQLLWEPISKIIESHARGLKISSFWKIFKMELSNADEFVLRGGGEEVSTRFVDCDYDTLNVCYQKWQQVESKPDHVNRRLLLWKTLDTSTSVEIAEAKTRDVSEFFLNFYEREFVNSNSEMIPTQNIKQHDEMELDRIEAKNIENESEDSQTKDEKDELTTVKPSRMSDKNKFRTLLQYLSVFSKVKSPKSMYREQDLKNLYYGLLKHKNFEVQKGALDCILTYKSKCLLPYKENLYNLIDEKNFKNELRSFCVDRENSTILPEHREELMEVVLCIVYGKMNAKTGLRTGGGKSSGQQRRNLVVRFLGGCLESEKIIFVKMVFRHFERYLDGKISDLSAQIDLEKFYPIKKLQSSANMLGVILDQFGDSLTNETLMNIILKYIHVVGIFVKGAYEHHSRVHQGYQSALKSLRNSIINLMRSFFERFQEFRWNRQQLNDTFDIFVWPYLEKLNVEGIHSPTALLKLFLLWGNDPRFFPLLVKKKKEKEDEEIHVLPKVIELLMNEKSHYTVTCAILEMIENLLVLIPMDEKEKNVDDETVRISDEILSRIGTNDKLNYGSCILLPYVPQILAKIRSSLGRKSKGLNKRELFILFRISELVWEPEMSGATLQLLLPVILKKSVSSDEETLDRFLSSAKNLLRNVSEPRNYLNSISPLFAQIAHHSGRKLLLSIIDSITTMNGEDETSNKMKNIIFQVNAFDAKWIDQPDYQKRHDAFKTISTMMKEDEIDINLGILLIHNFYYFLKKEKDLSLRENSSHSWKLLAPHLLNKYKKDKDNNRRLLDTLFDLIKNGSRSNNDDLRCECISLLGHLARKCPENHFVLRDLNLFTNETDPEVDFFENSIHLQIHRRARAMTKLNQILKEQTVTLNVQTLTRFVLPLVSSYLCNEKYADKNSIVDAAIETIATSCRFLPWHQYEGLLRFYLNKLRGKIAYQKQLVRLNVAILDSFHFDLSKAEDENDHELNEKQKSSNGNLEINIDHENQSKTMEAGNEEEMTKDEMNDLDDIFSEQETQELVGEDEQQEEEKVSLKICEKTRRLCKSTATRVTYTIRTVLLPQLNRALAEMSHRDISHKINRKLTSYEQEEDDLIKVPLSLAVVKLLQKLPSTILENNLPRVFMKTCTFLKSRLESVRKVARETLQNMMLTLGPGYLSLLLNEMLPLLQRGFHAHVLVFTVHGVLNSLKEEYKPNDIDKILKTVLKLCNTDLFGTLSEEKEVAKIRVRTSEAKSSKSMDIYQILAQFVTEKCFLDLLFPLKNIIETSSSFKTVNKCQECLRRIAIGLSMNGFVSIESLLKFAYGTSSEKITQLLPGHGDSRNNDNKDSTLKQQKNKTENCLIIPKMPVGRSGIRISRVKHSEKANAHLLVEFGLRLCLALLKKDNVKKDEYFEPFLDPFVVLLKDCLKSKHVKLCTLTLQCLNWILKYNLPSIKIYVKEITFDLFTILHKYAAAGLSKGDNFDLVVAAFKTMSSLVREVNCHVIDQDQLKVLVLYVEQDMHDQDRRAIAFDLLRAILSRKFIIDEINEIMDKVAEMSIVSELNHVRNQARSVFHQYLMDYPLGQKLQKHVSFFLSQTNFEMQYGRESALDMIQSMINSFPLVTLKQHSGTFFVTLGARLVNEPVPELRKTVAACLTSLLNRLPKSDREPLFEIVTLWFTDRNTNHKRLAAQLCGIFVIVENVSFETRFETILPILMKQFGLENSPGKFVRINNNNANDDVVNESQLENDEEKIRVKDHHKFQVLQLLLKICAQCPAFLQKKKIVSEFANRCQRLLNHPHDWVRLAACQFLGYVLSTTNIEHLSSLLSEEEKTNRDESFVFYLSDDPWNSVKSLTLDLCDQLQADNLKTELAEQVIKNLVFLARVLKNVETKSNVVDNSKNISLLWLCKKLRKLINTEIVENPSSTAIRTSIFKWIAAVITALDVEELSSVLNHVMAPLVREMTTTEESNAPLRQLAKEVAGMMKKKIGLETYSEILSKIQQNLSIKRAERKRSRNQMAVTDPEMFAKKKLKRNEKKKHVKKRKIAEIKGTNKNFKRRKTVDLEDNYEIV